MKKPCACSPKSTAYRPARPAPLLVVHLLIWSIVFLAPFLLVNQHRDEALRILPWLLFPLATVMAGFYTNYLVLIPRLLFKRWTFSFFLSNLVLFGVIAAINEIWRHYLQSHGLMQDHQQIFPIEFVIFRALFGMVVIGGVAVAVRMTRQWYTTEGERRLLEAEGLRSELSFLKLQLSPHFLFNTLNNITVLIDEDSVRAKESVLHLSKLLRALLYEAAQDTIPVQSELRFLESYIELMRLRFGPELDFQLQVDLADKHGRMAPLLLMPLVENAFKHGIDAGTASRVHIQITTRDGMLHYSSENTHRPKCSRDKSGSGVGLVNLRKRLHLLYQDRHTYTTEVVNDTYYTRLSLALEPRSEESPG